MLLKNAYIENATKSQDIRIEKETFTAIADHLTPLPNEEVIDLNYKLVLPPFIEPHVHLDSALTAGQPKWNESGTLFEGIETWALRKKDLTVEDVKN
jgi:cytosine deaminase